MASLKKPYQDINLWVHLIVIFTTEMSVFVFVLLMGLYKPQFHYLHFYTEQVCMHLITSLLLICVYMQQIISLISHLIQFTLEVIHRF